MNPHRAMYRRRETFLALFLTIAFGCAIVVCFLMISNRLFFAILAVLTAMIFLGCLQYLLWGRPMRRNAARTEERNVLPGTRPTNTRTD
jgi:hypothetical protein